MNIEQNQFIPLIAYKFSPEENDLVDELLGKPVRRIFLIDEDKYSDLEKEKLTEMKEYLKSINYVLPESYTNQDMLRQLQGNDYDIKVTFDNIKKEVEWKAENLPIQLTDSITKILNTGFIYAHGRDNRYRPILVLNPGKYDKNLFPFQTWQLASVYFIEFLLNNYLIPGKIENWNIIVDCQELSITNIPWDLKNVFSGIKGVYRCRLFKLFLLNLSPIFVFAWNIAKTLIGPTVEAKATKVNNDEGKYNNLFKNINRNQIEKKYGGEAENLEPGNYFPETFYYPNYYSQNDRNDNKFMCNTEIDYFVENEEIFYEAISEEE